MKGAIAVLLLAVLHSTMTNAVPTEPKNFFPDLKDNLTTVTWAHAVNSKTDLDEALSSQVMMLEADVLMGKLNGDNTTTLPIMAHPPNTSSDLSLEEFVKTVMEKKDKKKGVKLDFKTMEAFAGSSAILKNLNENAKFPVFLNADIFAGPVSADRPNVLPHTFVDAAKSYENLTLSVGWTTKTEGGNTANQTKGYTDDHVNTAIEVLKDKKLSQPITYAVRANFAALSEPQMVKLVNSTDVKNATLTIWSSEDDAVNATLLSNLIKKVGVNNVYLDVPSKLKSQLKLDESGVSGLTATTMTVLGSLFVNFLLTAMPRRG